MKVNPFLDLHGIKHEDVMTLVEDFVYKNQEHFPLIIICGNSSIMINIVRKTLDKMGCVHEDSWYGVIRVLNF